MLGEALCPFWGIVHGSSGQQQPAGSGKPGLKVALREGPGIDVWSVHEVRWCLDWNIDAL